MSDQETLSCTCITCNVESVYQRADGRWVWCDETWQPSEVGYDTQAEAQAEQGRYIKWLNGPKENNE